MLIRNFKLSVEWYEKIYPMKKRLEVYLSSIFIHVENTFLWGKSSVSLMVIRFYLFLEVEAIITCERSRSHFSSEWKLNLFSIEVKFHSTGSYLCSLRPATLLRKRLWHRCLPVNFAKFLRTPSDACFFIYYKLQSPSDVIYN